MQQSKIWLSPPHMSGEEIKFVHEAFETNWVSPAGPHLTKFENELAAYHTIPHCAALSSGTAAIHLALIILGVKRGDEVLCSTFTFSGSCNPIAYQDATPVFVDSESTSWNMDPELLEEAILDRIKKTGKSPKAMILVHLYGMPAAIDRIMAVARKYGIMVIEDAVEAIGSSFKGQKLGTFGDFGVFSFNGNKIITTSGGGALVSKNEEWIKKTRFLATQARDAAAHYQHSEIGYNYRLSNICSGIGRGQLSVLDERVRQRRSNFNFYKNALGRNPNIGFQSEIEGAFSNRWLTTITFMSDNQFVTRERVRLALEADNIESRPLWKPMHLQPVFSGAPYYQNGVSEGLFNQGLCLPSGSAMTENDLNRTLKIVNESLKLG